MKFGLIYPNKKTEKMRTKRFLDAKKISIRKVTGLIEILTSTETLTMELEKIGNILIPLDGTISTSDKTLQKFNILNNLFRKAIREGKKTVINFLLANLSEDEIKLLREEH